MRIAQTLKLKAKLSNGLMLKPEIHQMCNRPSEILKLKSVNIATAYKIYIAMFRLVCLYNQK